jgi:transcriptional regulator with XRE-family HTH domain
LAQGDIEKRTGLLRYYVSRVENGHTVPAIETLEKSARAMEIELYQIFFEPNGRKQPQELALPAQPATKVSRKHAGVISRLGSLIPRISDRDQRILVGVAQKMAAR